MWDAMFKAQNAFEGVLSNFPNRFMAMVLRRIVFPLGRPYVVPSDALGHQVAKLLIEPSATRDRLTAGVFLSRSPDNPVAQVEVALAATIASEPVEAKIRAALKHNRLDGKLAPGAGVDMLVARARDAGVITAAEADIVLAARDATAKVIRVDDFAQDLGAAELRVARVDPTPLAAPSSQVAHKAAA